jgi:hypothetical protein
MCHMALRVRECPCAQPGPSARKDPAALAFFNAQSWEPPWTVKKRCSRCSYWFTAPRDSQEPRCPDYIVG